MTYKEFIQDIIDTRGQWNIPDGEYYESHHILPRCLGGNWRKKTKHQNIIWLYPEEHYMAHKLLALENPDCWSLVDAWNRIHFDKRHDMHDISSDEYSLLRKQFSILSSELNIGRKDTEETRAKKSNSAKGRLLSEETKNKISISHRGENNPMYNIPSPMLGRKHTEETKRLISNNRRGKCTGEDNPMYGLRGELSPNWGRVMSDDTKKKISISHMGENNPRYGKPGTRLGKKNTPETNKAISEAQKIKVIDVSTGKIYESMSDAAIDINYSISSISQSIRNNKKLKGHEFKLYKEDN